MQKKPKQQEGGKNLFTALYVAYIYIAKIVLYSWLFIIYSTMADSVTSSPRSSLV